MDNILQSCELCPHRCLVDRTAGDVGICGETDDIRIGASVAHYGEEPALTGGKPVGNIFVTGCSLSCVYCQNCQISQQGLGRVVSTEELAEEMLRLQEADCGAIGWVTPQHQLPGLLQAWDIARKRGMNLPLIYNTNSFERVEILRELDGLVDIYLADLRYSDDMQAMKYSDAANYVQISRAAVEEMYRQVGAFVEDKRQGLVIRLLVLPEDIAGLWDTMCFIALELSPKVPISLMSQYRPVYRAKSYPELNRRITPEEYRAALKMAEELGFETVYVQELESEQHMIPDFRKDEPF